MRLPVLLQNPVFAVVALATASSAQCTDWKPGFHLSGSNHNVHAFASHDDGTGHGAEIYAAGQFTRFGGMVARYIVKWDGARFEEVGGGRPDPIGALCVFDDGTGAKLYAATSVSNPTGGATSGVARWNGTNWEDLAGGVNVRGVESMVVHDDGSGPALYVAGYFPAATAPEVYLRNVARFDGTTWSSVGVQSPGASGGAGVRALAVYDDGSGPVLYAGGTFANADGSSARNLARWDGSTWTEVGGGVGHATAEFVDALAVWHDAQGVARLVVGGDFADLGGAPAANFALWDGTAWSTTGTGAEYAVESFAVVPQPSRADDLYVGGSFAAIDDVPALYAARYDGSTWSPLGAGFDSTVFELAAIPHASGTRVFAGGAFTRAGDSGAAHVAAWSPASASWSALVEGDGVGHVVNVLRTLDDGTGPMLYAGGIFRSAGGVLAERVARFDGEQWSAMGAGLSGQSAPTTIQVAALATFDEGNGVDIFAGGAFRRSGAAFVDSIARWDGTSWQPVGGGLLALGGGIATVYDLVAFDDGSGPALYAGGAFGIAGGVTAYNIARWDGVSWSPVGAGLDGPVHTLAIYDDGAGPKLVAGGNFFQSGSTAARRIARWDGTSWSPLGAGAGHGAVWTLYPFDAGTGAGVELYAGGAFWDLGVPDTFLIGKWNGTSWVSISTGFGGIPSASVQDLVAFDDGLGGGAQLYAGGVFAELDGVAAPAIARFDGASWSALGAGIPGSVQALSVFGGGAPDLMVGGYFSQAGSVEAVRVASYGRTGAPGCPDETGDALCAGDGTATGCPCANVGSVGRGCQNSSSTGGGRLRASGQAHLGADTVRLVAEFLPSSSMALFLQGTQAQSAGQGVVFGDGLRCVGGSVTRLRARPASGGVAQLGEGLVGDPEISVAGHVPGATTRYYQVWYRDANPSFCTSATFNLTNAIRIRWVD